MILSDEKYEQTVRAKVTSSERLWDLWKGAGRQIGTNGTAHTVFMDPYEVRALVEYIIVLKNVLDAAKRVLVGEPTDDLAAAVMDVMCWERTGAL